jgi:Na+/H+-translocating membrane pyrophosphatase
MGIYQCYVYQVDDDEETQGLTQDKNKIATIKKIKNKILEGANAFLFKEYSIMTLFIGIFELVV